MLDKKEQKDSCGCSNLSHVGVVLVLVLDGTVERKTHADGQSDCKRQLRDEEAESGESQDPESARSIDHFAATPLLLSLDLLLDVL